MNCIVNVTPAWGIGQEDKLLVSVAEDLKHFKSLTVGKTVICGRKTLATFPGGKPLKNRNTILLSSDEAFCVEGAEVVHNEQELFARLRELPSKDLCVIGGESIYRLLLPYCDRAYVTITYTDLPADRFFPNLDREDAWELAVQGAMHEENGMKYRFCEYRNRNPLDF